MKLNFLIVAVIAGTIGWAAGTRSNHAPELSVSKAATMENRLAGHQCPMHPWVKSVEAADCSMCGMKLVPVSMATGHGDKPGCNYVMLEPGSQRVIGVRTSEVARQPLIRTLRVSGMIGEDESQHGIISALVEGRIDGLAMNCEGEQVHIRQPVATIFSRTLLNAANDYNRALKAGSSELEAARHRLEQYGLVAEQINSIPTRQEDDLDFGIISKVPGTIVKAYVSEGQYVKEGEKMFEVADFTKMWFVFTAYEQDLPFLQKGQFVRVSTASLPGETFRAKIAFINPNLNETTRSAQVRVVLENPGRRLLNRSLAEGVVELGAPEVLAIPRSAVLCPGNSARVYVERAPGVYEQRLATLGRGGDTLWEVLDGLEAGERVVSAGNLLIDGQAQLAMENSAPTLKQ